MEMKISLTFPEPETDLTEYPLQSEDLSVGFLHFKRDVVRLPDQQTATREFIVHQGAVMVIPQFEDGTVVLEAQYRYPMQKVMLEFPAGKLDGNESSLVCAKRELEEETGLSAKQYHFMNRIHPSISYSTEFIDLYLARDLTLGAKQLDQGEFLETFRVPFQELLEWVREGKITDVKTIIGTMWLEKWMSGQWGMSGLTNHKS